MGEAGTRDLGFVGSNIGDVAVGSSALGVPSHIQNKNKLGQTLRSGGLLTTNYQLLTGGQGLPTTN